ncbi:hypothetical protein W911_09270 [Hyphomicrobium nitrativorans NL23]|uniref:Uncharacterized protein n=1 Tax=Hyphomicrobium nitrativorans NL23 TaxID=1029756 RepID=V5SJL2_9HYPH|nr:hypothetical protein [Hyphomicrobium nitrativorans]AHB50149.1 hypothetical protein W911_09270 [Hyphomicrobium nitrativorans NL23]
MAHYIPGLSQIVSGIRGVGRRDVSETAPSAPVNVSRLAALIPDLRRRLPIGTALSDEALLASLVSIARHTSEEARWRAAEASTLGQHLAVGSRDKYRDLVTLIAVLPKPYL